MSTIKTALAVLAFLCVYGIVGRMDYDDAVMLENAQRQFVHMDCPASSISPANQSQLVKTGWAESIDEPTHSAAGACNVLIY